MEKIKYIQEYPLKSVFVLSIPIIAFLFLQTFTVLLMLFGLPD